MGSSACPIGILQDYQHLSGAKSKPTPRDRGTFPESGSFSGRGGLFEKAGLFGAPVEWTFPERVDFSGWVGLFGTQVTLTGTGCPDLAGLGGLFGSISGVRACVLFGNQGMVWGHGKRDFSGKRAQSMCWGLGLLGMIQLHGIREGTHDWTF